MAIANGYEDDDVVSSDELGEGISDDSEDLMAAAEDSDADMSEQDSEEGEERDEDESDDAPEANGHEEADADGAAGGAARERRAKAGKAAAKGDPLSLDEHDMLLTAQTTSDSAVIQLQVSELLKETRVKLPAPVEASMHKDLDRLRRVITAIAPHKVEGAETAAGFIQDLGLDPKAVTLSFQPPTVVAAVGSMPLGACVARSPDVHGPHLPTLDIAVAMPEGCFYKKAHLNYRYHALRALYMATVAHHLAASPAFADRTLQWEALQSDPTRPVLLVTGTVATNGHTNPPHPNYQLRLIPCLTPGVFPLPRLAPDRNGVRWVTRSKAAAAAPATTPAQGAAAPAVQHVKGTGGGVSTAHLAPTPSYNMGIVADTLVLTHATILQRAAAALPAFSEGLLLLKVWAHQHQLAVNSGSADGLDSHTLAMLLAHLAEQGKLNAAMSPLQIFRVALHSLSGTDPSCSLTKGCAMTRLTSDVLTAAVQASAAHLLHPDPAHAVAAGSARHGTAAAAAAAHKGCAPADAAEVLAAALGAAGAAATLLAGPSPGAAAFYKAHAAALVDPTGWCNVAGGMSKAAVAAVASAARASAAVLNAPADGESALASVLLSPSRFATCYDYMWAVDVPARPTYEETHKVKITPGPGAGGEGDEGGHAFWHQARVGDCCVWRDQEAAVESIVRTALTDRARLVRAVRRPVPPQPLTALSSGLLTVARPHEVLVGAKLDPTLALRLVDIGPAADDTKAAARFRAFWGEAAELRRFQDGKISEVVVWGAPSAAPGSRHAAPDRAVSYAIQRHKPAGSPGTLRSSGLLLDSALRGVDDDPSSADESVTASRLLEAATDKLSKQLRNMQGLALKIVAVQALSPAARHTEVVTPLPHPLAGGVPPNQVNRTLASGGRLPRVLQPQELLVELEPSGRWPADPTAFVKMKAALGVQLAQTIETSLGLTALASETCVDVYYEGFAYRLTLYSGRDEAMLLEQSRGQHPPTTSTNPTAPKPNPQLLRTSPESRPLTRSWHHGLVSNIGGTNPAFGPACRLAKRWVSVHMMSNHVCEEAVELLVAAAFTGLGPREQPGSRVAGFLRFLELLSQHPWISRPLVVDPDRTLTAADYRAITSHFSERHTQQLGAVAMPAMYIVTPRDRTSDKPTPQALARLSHLAHTCLAATSLLIEQGLPHTQSTDPHTDPHTDSTTQAFERAVVGALFSPQAQQFDVLLTLREEALPLAADAAPAWLTAGVGKRCRQPDALSRALDEMEAQAPPKRARAFLNAFPEKAVATRKPAALKEELLVGFDPLSILMSKVQDDVTGHPNHHHHSHTQQGPTGVSAGSEGPQGEGARHRLPLLGTLCADATGGRVVGVKWAATAFLPALAKATTCQFNLPCIATQLSASAATGTTKGAGVACVPDVPRILAEISDIGLGMIEGIEVVRGCEKLPTGGPAL